MFSSSLPTVLSSFVSVISKAKMFVLNASVLDSPILENKLFGK